MESCDTFVSISSKVIFGKVSDRPPSEPQNLEYFAGKSHEKDEKIKCTYIEIDQAKETCSVALSRPFWMWGAEFGVSQYVAIGNEAIWTRLTAERSSEPGLIGMDLVRLGLERGKTAKEALNVIINLLERYGQSGNCKFDSKFEYDNSFIIADAKEAFVLETTDRHWVVEKVKPGTLRHTTNKLSIRKPDLMSPNLLNDCKERGWWKEGEVFDWTQVMTVPDLPDVAARKRALDREAFGSNLKPVETAKEMTDILRLHNPNGCGFCQHGDGPNLSASMAAIVSVLDNDHSIHFFTCTPRPCQSIFKPWKFGQEIPPQVSRLASLLPTYADAAYLKQYPDSLFWIHELATKFSNNSNISQQLDSLQTSFETSISFSKAVEQELQFYLTTMDSK